MTHLQVNNTMISVFQRKRPRGDWMNVKMTGMAGESPVGFIKGEALTGTRSYSALLRLVCVCLFFILTQMYVLTHLCAPLLAPLQAS